MSTGQRESNRRTPAVSGGDDKDRSTATAPTSPASEDMPRAEAAADSTAGIAPRRRNGQAAARGPADASLLVVAGQFHIQSRKPVLLLTALALILSSLSFPPVGAWWLGYVCLVPWLVCVCTALPSRRVYAASYFLGVSFYAVNVHWLYAVTPPGYIALCLWFALSFVFPAWAVRHMFRRYSAPVALTFPLAWIAFEFLRGLTLAGFPWLYLGHTQYRNLTLIQVSDLVGVHGVSFFVAMVNGWLADLLIQPILISSRGRSLRATRLALGTALTALTAAFLLTYGAIRLSESESATRPGPSIAVIQQDFSATVSREAVDQADPFMMLRGYVALARRAAARSPDLIVMPETAWVAELNREFLDATTDDLEAIRQRRYPKWTIQDLERQRKVLRETSDSIHALASESGATIVIGAHATEWRDKDIPPRAERFNSAYVFPPNSTRYSGRYDKMHLVLFGEFVPFRYSGLHSVYEWLNSLTPWGAEGIEYSLGFGEKARRFQAAAPSQGGRTYRFSTPICYEDVVTGVIRRFVGDGAEKQVDFLLNLSNDGWFHHSSELEQHLAACVFRAVEYRVPVARSVNTGISAFVDSSGQIHHRVRATRDDAASFERMRDALEKLLLIVEPAARAAGESPGGAELNREVWQAAWNSVNERLADEIRQATQSRWDEFMKGALPENLPRSDSRPAGEDADITPAVPTEDVDAPATRPARRDESEFDYLRVRLREMLEKVALASAEGRAAAWSELAAQVRADMRTMERWMRKPETAPGLRIATIRSDSRHTFYAQMGDVFAWGCVAACGLMLMNWLVVRLRRPSRRKRRKSKVESRNETSKRRNIEKPTSRNREDWGVTERQTESGKLKDEMESRNDEELKRRIMISAGRSGAGAGGMRVWGAHALVAALMTGAGCVGAGRGVPLEERQKVEQRALLALTLATRDPAAAVRVQAIESLQDGAPRVGVRYFMEALEDEYPGVRFAALMALGSLRYAPARDMIRPRLRDADPHVRMAARFAMCRLGDPSGVPDIVAALRTDRSAAVRGNAALILGRLGDAGAVGALRGALKEQDESVRLQVLEAMALLGDKKAVGELGLIAYSSTGPKMVLALLALGEARRSELRNLFIEQFESASYDEVRLAAAAALARIGEPVGVAYAQDRLRNYRPDRTGVDTPEQQAARVRILATVVLGAARDPAALPALDDALRHETNESVRVAAARAVLMVAGSVDTGESPEVAAGMVAD